MGVKVKEVLEKIFELESKISEITDEFINYLENESYLLKLKSDVLESEDYLILKIEVPGISKEDIKLYYRDNNLIVKGVKRKEYNEDKVEFLVAERRFGSFYNIFPIPPGYDMDKVEVVLRNGVMRIKIPKKREPTVIKKIEIE